MTDVKNRLTLALSADALHSLDARCAAGREAQMRARPSGPARHQAAFESGFEDGLAKRLSVSIGNTTSQFRGSNQCFYSRDNLILFRPGRDSDTGGANIL